MLAKIEELEDNNAEQEKRINELEHLINSELNNDLFNKDMKDNL